MSDRFVGTRGAATIMGVSPTGLKNWVAEGRVPAPIGRLEPRGDRIWRREDLEAVRDQVQKRTRPQCERDAA
jgi:predicted site-specific integrase-resolvase